MKNPIILLLLLCVTSWSCKKQTSSVIPPDVTDTVYTIGDTTSGFYIHGIKDILTYSWVDTNLLMHIIGSDSGAHKINLKVDGLPENVKGELTSATGYTPFNTTLQLKMNFVRPGNYPLTFTANNADTTKAYTVSLIVDSMTKKECDLKFLGSIYPNVLGYQMTTIDDATDSIVSEATWVMYDEQYGTVFNGLTLSHSSNPSQHFYSNYIPNHISNLKLMINCNDGSLIIPTQTVLGTAFPGPTQKEFTVYGSGSIDIAKGQFSFSYTTEHDNNGTTVIKKYTCTGPLM